MVQLPRRCDHRGETLVEVLVAIVILGIAGTAIFTGLALAVKASDFNRKEATAGSYVRSVVEAVETYVTSGHYQPCATTQYATYINSNPTLVGVPGGYVLTQDFAQKWNGTTTPGSWGTCGSPGNDNGVQRVRFILTNAGSSQHPTVVESLYVVLRKPCNGAVGTPCS